jgi:putative methanogen marker protein 4
MTRTVGIGIAGDIGKVIQSVQAVSPGVRVIGYCRPEIATAVADAIPVQQSETPEEALTRDLFSGVIDAAIRGTLPANATLKALKRAAKVDHLERIALLETASGKKFLLAPVGIDEGWTVAQKLELIKKGKIMARKFGLSEKAAILSGGRLGDVGRHPLVDQTIADAEHIARVSGAVHYEILIEDAIRNCGVIIAPDGISGNLIFRTLAFLGAGKGLGAPVVNIPRVFVDTSRASPDYQYAIHSAVSLLD